MTSPTARNDIHIDRACSAAICEEIADRLRIDLAGKPARLPQRMMMLVGKFAGRLRRPHLATKSKPQ